VLAGVTALSALTGCAPAPDTQLVPGSVVSPDSILSVELDVDTSARDWVRWNGRQNYFLTKNSESAAYKAWLSKLDGVKNRSLLERANEVNDLVNAAVKYVSDRVNYGTQEYCASAAQTISRGSGDCEDFAIAKFYALKYLNVPESRMCVLVVASDTAASKKIDHGVLAVDTSAANNWANCLVLDNCSGSLKTLGQNGYEPYYMINSKEMRRCTAKVLKPPAP
jgi:predicted transglutaminase-like cysteine proteinase